MHSKAVFKQGLVTSYAIEERNGVRIGFFEIMGHSAAGDAPFASPVTFRDPLEISRQMVNFLREKEKTDMVVCLSHSGLDGGTDSEDRTLAREVPGIDIIISGHSHTLLKDPLLVNDTIIVQVGNYGRAVGVLDVTVDGQKVALKNYDLVLIDDQIPADPRIQSRINTFITEIDGNFLREYGFNYWKVIGKTDFDMPIREEESTAGNLLADAIRWYVDRYGYDPAVPATRVRMSIKANGVIRDDILKGKTGRLTVADIFRALPLGIGMDEEKSPGYPLVTCYIYGYEIKRALEVVTSVYPLKGSDYFLQLSGVRFTYNPFRMLFDRVTDIRIQTEDGTYQPLDYSRPNKELYRIAADIYEATFLQVIGQYTYNILNIVPKDRQGNPIDSLVDFRVDADPSQPGIQELKEWMAVMSYITHFDSRTGTGPAQIPEKYRRPEGRIIKQASLNPVNLLYRGTAVTWAALAAILSAAAIIIFVLFLVIKRIRR